MEKNYDSLVVPSNLRVNKNLRNLEVVVDWITNTNNSWRNLD